MAHCPFDCPATDETGSVTPEHLSAGAYAACFLGALKSHAAKAHVKSDGLVLVARAHLEEDSAGGLTNCRWICGRRSRVSIKVMLST